MRAILLATVGALFAGCGSDGGGGVACGATHCAVGQICCNVCGSFLCEASSCPGIQCASDMAAAPDGAAPVDLAASDQASGDLATVASFACGPSQCGGGQGCCTSDKGVTGACMPIAQGCGGAPRFDCGGPENCVPGTVCCYAQGTSDCLPDTVCAGAGGQPMCHDATVCGGGTCCPLAAGSSFSACSSGACP